MASGAICPKGVKKGCFDPQIGCFGDPQPGKTPFLALFGQKGVPFGGPFWASGPWTPCTGRPYGAPLEIGGPKQVTLLDPFLGVQNRVQK